MDLNDLRKSVMDVERTHPDFLDYVQELRCYLADGGTALDFTLNVVDSDNFEAWHQYIGLRTLVGDPVVPWDEVL